MGTQEQGGGACVRLEGQGVAKGLVGGSGVRGAEWSLFPPLLFLLLLLFLSVVASEQAVQVLLEVVRAKGLWDVFKQLQVHLLPMSVPHHSPLLRAGLMHLGP